MCKHKKRENPEKTKKNCINYIKVGGLIENNTHNSFGFNALSQPASGGGSSLQAPPVREGVYPGAPGGQAYASGLYPVSHSYKKKLDTAELCWRPQCDALGMA